MKKFTVDFYINERRVESFSINGTSAKDVYDEFRAQAYDEGTVTIKSLSSEKMIVIPGVLFFEMVICIEEDKLPF